MLSGEALQRSDEAQRAIGELQSPKSSPGGPGEKLRLLAQEGLPAVWGRRILLEAAMKLSRDGGNHMLAAAWLKRARALVKESCGEDGPGYAAITDLANAVEDMARMTKQIAKAIKK